MVDRLARAVFITCALIFLLFGYTFEYQSSISGHEKFALIQLRSSLGLRSRDWPIKSDPCARWVGIECANGRVTGINISGFRRTRRGIQNPQFSVESLQNLTHLTSFNASSFALHGSIPEWLGLRLPSLQVLDLRSCLISGYIPFTIGNLSNLVELYLSDNKLIGILPSSLGQLSGLSVLDLSKNSLTGSIPESFSNLGNITLLDVSSNFLSGVMPTGIGRLFRLQFLNLSGNSLSSSIPTELGDLSSLVDLDLSSNSLQGSLPSTMTGLRNLQRMIIGRNFVSGTLPGYLFTPLIHLRFVVLSHNDFSGDFPNELWSFPSLQFLDVSGNNFTGQLPYVNSLANTTSIVVFNVSRNMFYGNITPFIMKFISIDISGNYFEGPIPFYVRNNTSLASNCFQNVTDQRNETECTSFYADRNLIFDNFGKPNVTQPPQSSKKGKRSTIILSSVFGSVGLLLLILAILVLLFVSKPNHNKYTTTQKAVAGPVSANESPPTPSASLMFSTVGNTFTYQQILQATNKFHDANLLKHGHSGDLFLGLLESEIHVVIKKVDFHSPVKRHSCQSELELCSKVSHPRLVSLLGHCLENENEKFLVYKKMPNADLSSSLFRRKKLDNSSLTSLDWITRLKIAIGVAEGISYLHHECMPPLVHRDVQASSILLDDKFEVRLGSLSEVCPQESDTHQNIISKFLRLPQISDQDVSGAPNASCAYDVYCFGKVLLELVTGNLGISSSSDAAMKDWMEATLPYISIYDKELVSNIVDPSLIIDEDHLEEVWAVAIVARSCLNPKPTQRPLMRYILKALENPLKVVREENSSSIKLRSMSSRGSWNSALFGSWIHGSSDVATSVGCTLKVEGASSLKLPGTTGSRGSNQTGMDVKGQMSSNRVHSTELGPKHLDKQDSGMGKDD